MTRKFRYIGVWHTMVLNDRWVKIRIESWETIDSTQDPSNFLRNQFEIVWASSLEDLNDKLRQLSIVEENADAELESALKNIDKETNRQKSEAKKKHEVEAEKRKEQRTILEEQADRAKDDARLGQLELETKIEQLNSELEEIKNKKKEDKKEDKKNDKKDSK